MSLHLTHTLRGSLGTVTLLYNAAKGHQSIMMGELLSSFTAEKEPTKPLRPEHDRAQSCKVTLVSSQIQHIRSCVLERQNQYSKVEF